MGRTLNILLTISVLVLLHHPSYSNAACPSGQAHCDNGQCTQESYICNGLAGGCDDDSDELPANCAGCSAGSRRCDDGSCTLGRYWCNGLSGGCPDGSDETHCALGCSSSQEKCDDGSCVAGSRWCDGRPDCRDGSDERHCGPVTHCLKCDGARSLSECSRQDCMSHQTACKWEDAFTPSGWIFNGGCIPHCENGHTGVRETSPSDYGVYKGCCNYNGCDGYHYKPAP